MKRIRTRYAPSPTGYLHIGGARSALFGYLLAKHNGGDFIVRIEDTDVERNVPGGEASQLDNLAWLGIIPDESPRNPKPQYGKYRQSEKLDRYDAIAFEMVKAGTAYKAYDSSEELDAQRKEQELAGNFSFRYDRKWLKISEEEIAKRDAAGAYTIRIALKQNKDYAWNDIVRGTISVNTNDIGDWVIRKQDGYPTYNFAVVVDDFDMEITHVLRGEEHITNTPKQLAVYDALGWEAPQFGHLTIITNMEGKKLSKRDTTMKQFIEDYKNSGYPAHAIFNFLTLLGWTHPDAKEVMSHEEIIRDFQVERLSKSPSKFDIVKMNWFAKEYMKKTPNAEIIPRLNFGNKSNEWKDLFVETFKQSASTITEIQENFKTYEDTSIKAIEKTPVLISFAKHLNSNEFSPEGIQVAINATKEETGAKGKDLFMPIRMSTTYVEHGPELAKAIYLVGEELVKQRLA